MPAPLCGAELCGEGNPGHRRRRVPPLPLVARQQSLVSADGDGGATHYNFVNNRFCWRASRTSDIPKLRGQLRPPQEKLLLDETENRFLPVKFEPAVPVPGAPEQFRYIGALQSPEQRIADRVGVQEER